MTQPQDFSPLTSEDFWQFSLHYYTVAGVKDACLTLQNRYHGNVNFALLLIWLDQHQLSFDRQGWQQLWHSLQRCEHLLTDFRELRRKLKASVVDTLYRESLQFELHLEQQQQHDLVATLATLSLVKNTDSPLAWQYCHQLGASDTLYQSLVPNASRGGV